MSLFIITGRLGRDAELKTLQSGKKVCQFSIAEDRGFGEKKHTAWIKCALFGDRAEKLSQYLTKGTTVEAWGEIAASAFVGKDGKPQASLDLRVSEVKLHGGGQKRDERGDVETYKDGVRIPSRHQNDDEIPF